MIIRMRRLLVVIIIMPSLPIITKTKIRFVVKRIEMTIRIRRLLIVLGVMLSRLLQKSTIRLLTGSRIVIRTRRTMRTMRTKIMRTNTCEDFEQ